MCSVENLNNMMRENLPDDLENSLELTIDEHDIPHTFRPSVFSDQTQNYLNVENFDRTH